VGKLPSADVASNEVLGWSSLGSESDRQPRLLLAHKLRGTANNRWLIALLILVSFKLIGIAPHRSSDGLL
jgi:hypothetical protein